MLKARRHNTKRLVWGIGCAALLIAAYMMWSGQQSEIEYIENMVYELEHRIETIEQSQ